MNYECIAALYSLVKNHLSKAVFNSCTKKIIAYPIVIQKSQFRN